MSRVVVPPKTAGETITWNVDFSDRMATAETISAQTCTVAVYSGVDPTPPTFAAAASGQSVNVTLNGGVAGVTYSAVVQATTSLSQILQKSFFLTVTNPVT